VTNISLLEEFLGEIEVEWKALGDVGDFVRGKRFVKADMVSQGFPCIHYGELYTHYGVSANESKSFINPKLASQLRVANHGDVVIVSAGETVEDIGNATAWLGNSDVVIHDACFSYKSELNPKYVSYFLRTAKFREQIKSSISSGKISAINAAGLRKARIPIPHPQDQKRSLDVQAEIVRILDAFTELSSKLSREIALRQKQYEYYRDLLFNFPKPEATA
jgi:type I restriction enzyme, S subunit